MILSAVFTSSDGDKFVDLGKKKRVTVRSFKGWYKSMLELPRAAINPVFRCCSRGYSRILRSRR